jgi:hypothetical protein
MPDDKNSSKTTTRKTKKVVKNNSASGGIYGLALIGALVYYFQQATTFWDYVLGFLKALVWPAFLVYELLKFLKM